MKHFLDDYVAKSPKAISDKRIMYAEGELLFLGGMSVASVLASYFHAS
jgi:hypothetical protein